MTVTRRIPGTKTGLCSPCQQLFAGESAADAHRVGPMTDRRCLSRDEMLAKGMWVDAQDRWHGPTKKKGTPNPWGTRQDARTASKQGIMPGDPESPAKSDTATPERQPSGDAA